MKRYQSELLRVINIKTNKRSYYVKKCDVFTRVTLEDYDKRYDEADGFSCVHTKTSKTHIRHYITAIYEYHPTDADSSQSARR